MTTISAAIIADSLAPSGSRITTMQLRYPRWIHAEFMTHRVFSRNASSSRAVPVKRLIEDVQRDTATPIYWGKNQKGMQADGHEHNAPVEIGAHLEYPREDAWLRARDAAIRWALAYDRAGYAKQLVNRLLEPFSHINVVVTATKWENFFALRDHPDAEPHICHLAQEMRKAMDNSSPRLLAVGEWHAPYLGGWPFGGDYDAVWNSLRQSVARCARTSYLTYEGKTPTLDEDLLLFERLVTATPLHASPAEHQAIPLECFSQADFEVIMKRTYVGREVPEGFGEIFSGPDWGANLGRNWVQLRKLLPNENMEVRNGNATLAKS